MMSSWLSGGLLVGYPWNRFTALLDGLTCRGSLQCRALLRGSRLAPLPKPKAFPTPCSARSLHWPYWPMGRFSWSMTTCPGWVYCYSGVTQGSVCKDPRRLPNLAPSACRFKELQAARGLALTEDVLRFANIAKWVLQASILGGDGPLPLHTWGM